MLVLSIDHNLYYIQTGYWSTENEVIRKKCIVIAIDVH